MKNQFKIGDEAVATTTNTMTGYTRNIVYKVLTVDGDYIEICTDYGRYEKVSSIFFMKG